MLKTDLNMKLDLIHGFAHKIRLQILECIRYEEKTVSQIVEEIEGNQSSVSQHLACLKGCGLIANRQEGKYVFYSMRNDKTYKLLEMFDELLGEVKNDMDSCKEHMR